MPEPAKIQQEERASESSDRMGSALDFHSLSDPGNGGGPSSRPAPALQLFADPASKGGGPIQREARPVVNRGGNAVTVQAGDSLWRIAQVTYGKGTYWRRVADANRDVVRGRALIYPGDVLTMPVIEVEIMDALNDERNDPEGLLDLIGSIPDDNYDAFRTQLTQAEAEVEGQFLQTVDMMRNTGMTVEEMGEEQRRFMTAEAARRGMSIGEFIASETASRGYGSRTATWWPGLTPEEQADWQARFDGAVVWLRENAPERVRAVITEAEENGGSFVWAPARCEELGAFGYTRSDWSLYVGQHWLEAYETNPEDIYSNLVHEMGGHNEYGDTQSWAVFDSMYEDLPESERNLAEAGGNSLYSAYGYMETEIWAELREHEFVGPNNPTDLPADDVERQLGRIHTSFAPVVAESLARSLYQRARSDSRITDGARQLLAQAIENVFGFRP